MKAILSVFTIALLCVSVWSGEKLEKETEPKAAGQAGMVVTLDGNRGQSEMPADLRAALSQMVNTSTEGLKEEQLPTGGYSVDLQGRFMSAMVITVDENDAVKAECFAPDDARVSHEGHDHSQKDPQ